MTMTGSRYAPYVMRGITSPARVPTLLFDAENGPASITKPFTHSRSGTATYYDSDGVLQTAASDTIRIDIHPNDEEKIGLLIEESKTNFLKQSEAFGSTSWTAFRASVTSNQTAAPDGSTTMDLVTASSGFANVAQTITASSGQEWTYSAYLKKSTSNKMLLLFFSTVTTYDRTVNFATGALEAGSNTEPSSYGIEDVGGDIYRVNMTATMAAGVSSLTAAAYVIPDGGTWATVGSSSDSFYIWGAQLEQSNKPSSYIPTTTAAVSRAADTLTIASGDDFDNFWNESQGTFLFEATVRFISGSATLCQVDDDSNNERHLFWQTGNNFQYFMADGGTTYVQYNVGAWTGANDPVKVVAAMKADDFSASDEGSAVTTDSSGPMPSPDQATFGTGVGNSTLDGMWIKRIAYWPRRLTDEEIVGLSA